MSEEKNEMLELLKALVEKVNELEKAVYNKDNLLMKSGWVETGTPRPKLGSANADVDNIAKMDWSDITEMVGRLENQERGGY
jgi:hypothetical protein|tara:strand:+ start:14929 stop:15174 length:246 start_codon:yes stop_codon:yes gene_type:complete